MTALRFLGTVLGRLQGVTADYLDIDISRWVCGIETLETLARSGGPAATHQQDLRNSCKKKEILATRG